MLAMSSFFWLPFLILKANKLIPPKNILKISSYILKFKVEISNFLIFNKQQLHFFIR